MGNPHWVDETGRSRKEKKERQREAERDRKIQREAERGRERQRERATGRDREIERQRGYRKIKMCEGYTGRYYFFIHCEMIIRET